MRTPRRLRADVIGGAIGLGLVALSLVGMSGADGAAPISDGSDWGPQGLLSSDSAVSARWDNTDNAQTSVVPRNQRQVVPHTADKNYFDIDPTVLDAYDAHFGTDNGKGGLRVTVSQTTDLVNQAVTLDFSGADPDLTDDGSDSRSYFQVFQCWGAMDGSGEPDPQAADPDPQTCQVGAGGPDSVGGSAKREYRVVGGDPLVPGGDWTKYDTTSSLVEVPFLSIEGVESGSNLDLKNTFFNKTTTNELSHVVLPDSGSTQRQFEVQTGTESSGLGCGLRTDQASTRTCWLVVVPRVQGVLENLGPTSPSLWAQRIQVQLGFRDVVLSCGSGARSLLAGSEMLADAAAGWIPGVCESEDVALGYTRVGDEVARNQYAGGSASAVLTTQPVPARTPAIHVPVALTAPVVAYNIDYEPVCLDEDRVLSSVETEAEAEACGYDSLEDLRADIRRAGLPIRDLRLNARLVAKLLTQSYQNSMINCGPDCAPAVDRGTMPAWTLDQPTTLTDDPEFRLLNPQLHLKRTTSLSEPIVEALRSDAANQLWRWLLSDENAASFLSGCPDDAGVVINPFYSTRTYTGCTGEAADLDDAAEAARAAIDTPTGFVDVPLSYPPDGSPFPLPNWQQQPAEGDQPARTLVDHHPRVEVMQVGARDALIGLKPRNSEFCRVDIDPTCFPAPGKWKDPKTLQRPGQREIFAVTDAPSAARYKLPTARLCDDSSHCVGADTTSLRRAADRFVASAVTGVRGPAPKADLAGGAYPLAVPVYAAVRPSLPQSQRAAYAEALEFVVTKGQVPGYLPGDLAPGYAPLTDTLTADAKLAIGELRKAVAGKVTASAKPDDDESPSPTEPTASPTESAGPGAPDATLPQPSVAAPAPGPSAGAEQPAASAGPAVVDAATAPAAAATESYPGWLLPVGLALTIWAGIAGPVMRRRTSLRIR